MHRLRIHWRSTSVGLIYLLLFVGCAGEFDPPESIEGEWNLATIDGEHLPIVLGVDSSGVDGNEIIMQRTQLSAVLTLDHFSFGMMGAVVYQRLDVPDDPDTVTHVVLTQGSLYDYEDGEVVFQSSEFDFTLHEGHVNRRNQLIVDADIHLYGPAELTFVRATP